MSTLPELQVQLDILLEQTKRAEHNLPHINLIDARFSFLALIRELSAQAAEVDAMRADAERYRWLRQQHWYEAALCVVVNPKNAVKLGHDCPSLERLDAAIDAARAALSQPTAQPAGGERERYEFVLAQCREAQDIAASRGWALNDIATASTTDPKARKIATEALLGAPQVQRAGLTDEQVFASEDFMSANGLYWGLPMTTLIQIVRCTERAHGITATKGDSHE